VLEVFNDLFEEVVTENILLILICCDKKKLYLLSKPKQYL